MEDRVLEFVDHLHEHFRYPVTIRNAHYQLPQEAGYSCEILPESLKRFEFPVGEAWRHE
jgi:L-fuconate dehydratase